MFKLTSIRAAIVVLWLALVGGGFALMSRYQNTPGAERTVAAVWPSGTELKLTPHGKTLIVFAHPRCPCSRSTIGELNRILARSKERVSAQVWFFQPETSPGDWSRSDLWRTAEAIPGVMVRADVEGRQAALFGAETSGSAFLYDSTGQVLFSGGITSGRGHAGDNAGEDAIVALIEGKPGQMERTRVYGCSLLECDQTVVP